MKKTVRTVLAAALALAAAPAFAQTYSQTVFFGDSLSDSGFYTPFLVQTQGPQAAIVGRFTTNPGLVWSEFLADFYGTNATPAWTLTTGGIVAGGGDNFAAGGATIVNGAGFPPTPPTQYAPSLTTQVNAYLSANGGQADRDALYTVWGGANDLFFHLNGATTQAQFLGSAVAEIGLVKTLTDAGARYILVPNIPDVGQTPFGLSQGAAGSAGISALVGAYNATLYGGLKQAGLRVIPLDTYHFLREISASPAQFGFVNVTSPACVGVPSSLVCSPGNFVNPDAAQNYAFADGVHPTTGAHELLADYATSVLEGPRNVSVMVYSEAITGRNRADRVASQLQLRPADEGMHAWAEVRGDYQKFDEDTGLMSNAEGSGPSLIGGVDWKSGDFTYGGFLGFGKQTLGFGPDSGEFSYDDTTLGGYLGWRGDNAWVSGQLGYSWTGYDLDRQFALGQSSRTHRGSADGSNLTIAVDAGWEFNRGALTHGPVVALVSQTVDVDGFAEDQSTLSTALAYPDQSLDSLVASAGWQLSYAMSDAFTPFARVTWDHEFEDPNEEAFASLQSIPEAGEFAVPGLDIDTDYGSIVLGGRSVFSGLDASYGVAGSVARNGTDNVSLFFNIGKAF